MINRIPSSAAPVAGRPLRHDQIRASRALGRPAAYLLVAVLFGGCGLSIVSPETTVDLRVQGVVRAASSGESVPNATVSLTRTEDYSWVDLTSVVTDAEGRYSLTYRLRHVATDPEFAGSCTVWHDDTSTSVELLAQAEGFALAFPGDQGARLRCTDALQTIDLTMAAGF
jgi:hypothetical protein